eukprot:1145912-Pelagomonas_calceolata.AAC.3
MASQAPSSSSNPLARWLKPVTPAQQLLAGQARLAKAKAARKGQPVKQKNPVGHPPGGDHSNWLYAYGNCFLDSERYEWSGAPPCKPCPSPHTAAPSTAAPSLLAAPQGKLAQAKAKLAAMEAAAAAAAAAAVRKAALAAAGSEAAGGGSSDDE